MLVDIIMEMTDTDRNIKALLVFSNKKRDVDWLELLSIMMATLPFLSLGTDSF